MAKFSPLETIFVNDPGDFLAFIIRLFFLSALFYNASKVLHIFSTIRMVAQSVMYIELIVTTYLIAIIVVNVKRPCSVGIIESIKFYNEVLLIRNIFF